MQTSRILKSFVLLAALIALCAISFAQTDSVVQVSDQKSGSVLVFPFYGSDGAGNDTRLTITNVGPAGVPNPGAAPTGTAATILNNLNVHLFFLDATCAQADVYLCFTKFQSYSFKASEWDPVTKVGELIAVAVDNMGLPISYNGLIGNAFVNTLVGGNRWIGNYSPEAFASLGALDANGNYYTAGNVVTATTAALLLNNGPRAGQVGYDAAASKFAAEFQSPVDSKGQAILTMGLAGTIGGALTGNAASGTGVIYRNDEKLFSYTPPTGGCSVISLFTDTTPRVVGGLANSIGTGKTGTAVWSVAGPAIGLVITPVQANSAWSGIRTLHKRDAGTGTLVMPVFMPICVL